MPTQQVNNDFQTSVEFARERTNRTASHNALEFTTPIAWPVKFHAQNDAVISSVVVFITHIVFVPTSHHSAARHFYYHSYPHFAVKLIYRSS